MNKASITNLSFLGTGTVAITKGFTSVLHVGLVVSHTSIGSEVQKEHATVPGKIGTVQSKLKAEVGKTGV